MVPSSLICHQCLVLHSESFSLEKKILKYADFVGCKNAVLVYESFDFMASQDILPFKKDCCLFLKSAELLQIATNANKEEIQTEVSSSKFFLNCLVPYVHC